MKSRLTTLCYIERDGQYLMLHRISKKNDVNKDKWIGVGGHFEEGESPEDCLLREVKEETGLTLTAYRFRGIITFSYEDYPTEYMCLYTGDGFEGNLRECEEGKLEWVDKDRIRDLNLWDGDLLFLELLRQEVPFFSLKLCYLRDGRWCRGVLNGQELELFDICGQDGMPTGHVKERSMVHQDGDLHRTVHIWVVRKRADGGLDVLLQKRSKDKDAYPGCYDVSSAGHVQAGDDFGSSAIRELREALLPGNRISGLSVSTKDTWRIPSGDGPLGTGKSVRSIFMRSRWRKSALRFRKVKWRTCFTWNMKKHLKESGKAPFPTVFIRRSFR